MAKSKRSQVGMSSGVKHRRSTPTLKTVPNAGDVATFIAGLPAGRREDARRLIEIMQGITRAEPVMWGSNIIGFGSYHYRYNSGREGDWFVVGFSPRKQGLTLYIMGGIERHGALLENLGPYKHGKSCLYLKNLDSIDLPTLKRLVRASVRYVRQALDVGPD